MKYTNIIDEFTWSYSRVSQFESCPYGFFLKYILHTESDRGQFFSEYGTFMHDILRRYFTGELRADELPDYYLTHFFTEVTGKASSREVFNRYFTDGLLYLKSFSFPERKILGVEEELRFDLDGVPFLGFSDLVSEDGEGIVATDHKSRTLSPRSARKKPTKSDAELDRYLRQLYLYSKGVKEKFGEFPANLEFNCFRSGELIREPFDLKTYESVLDEEKRTIEQIREEENWRPDIDWFRCRYLCDVSSECDYFQMSGGGK